MMRLLLRIVCAVRGHDWIVMSVGESSLTACLRNCGVEPVIVDGTR